jgi:septal ring factor EnvC (AmiA/AmiB activator)
VLAGVRTTRAFRLAGAGACLALAAAACGDAGQAAEETIDELRDDLESLETEVDEAVAEDEDLSESARDRLDEAVGDFGDAVDELGDDETAAETRDQIEEAGQELSERWDAALVALGCDETED